MQQKKALLFCFIFSFLFHIAALYILQSYSLWLSSSFPKEIPAKNWLSFIEKKEKNEVLKTCFEMIEKVKSPELKLEEMIADLKFKKSLPLQTPFQESLFQNRLFSDLKEPLISKASPPTFSLPNTSSINILDYLPQKTGSLKAKKEESVPFLPQPIPPELTLTKERQIVKEPSCSKEPSICFKDYLNKSLTESPKMGRAPQMISLPESSNLPSLKELETSSYSNSFDLDLVFIPKEEGKGYVFALTLIAKPDLDLPRFKQHITFLIDKANSIEQKRLSATKASVHQALEFLDPQDSFNIIAFDSKIEKMSPNDLPCREENFALAEEFLEKIELGSFFSGSDLYRPLFLTVPKKVEEDEIYTAILLSNGESLAKKGALQSILYDWTHYNQGRVALFTLSLNDLHSSFLEMAAAFNKGKLYNASSNRGLKRKLSKLTKSIKNPIAKDLVCTAITKSPEGKVFFYPKLTQMSYLYLDQPFVLLGETDSLDDFILFVQGKIKGRWLNIRKTVSFLNAKKGAKTLFEEIATQKAYDLYKQYGQDLNPKHLSDAEKILNPFAQKALLK